jgi:hypothetical protein
VLDISWYMASSATAWLWALGQPRFQHADLGLQGSQSFLALPRQRASFLGQGFTFAQPPRQLLLQVADLLAGIEPLREDYRQRHRGDQQGRPAQHVPPAAGGRHRISLDGSFHGRRSIARVRPSGRHRRGRWE